jgi:plasmid stabilization system protein ParE
MRLRFHTGARAELLAAVGYYERQLPGLGERFLEQVEGRAERLLEHPHAAPVVRADMRRAALTEFPYGLIYRTVADELWIIAVAHRRRRPGYWRARA